ncbi:MAG: hypothetical protein K6C97_06850 [Treponema sp.]|nr:hypothetical protein [Treponema sp.]
MPYINSVADYHENFFIIDLQNNCNPLDIFASVDSASTFLHEYIHFMQNVLTVNGIQRTNNFFNIYIEYIIQARKNKTSYFPISVNTRNTSKWLAYEQLFNWDAPKYKDIYNLDFSDRTKISETHIKLYGNDETDFEVENIYHQKYKLGNEQIIEAMAVLAEDMVFPSHTPSFPEPRLYSVVYELIDKIFPVLNSHELCKLELLEISLGSNFPMNFLITVLDDLNDTNYNDFDPIRFKNYILSKTFSIIPSNKQLITEKNELTVYNFTLKENFKLFNKLFYNSSFNYLKSDYKNLYQKAKELKKNNSTPISFFISRLVAKNTSDKERFLNLYLQNKLGFPLVFYQNNAYTIDQSFIKLGCLESIFYLLTQGIKECKIRATCQYQNPICLSEPYKRGCIIKNTEEYLCDYMQLIKALGIYK